jgi:hypothetical protein
MRHTLASLLLLWTMLTNYTDHYVIVILHAGEQVEAVLPQVLTLICQESGLEAPIPWMLWQDQDYGNGRVIAEPIDGVQGMGLIVSCARPQEI